MATRKIERNGERAGYTIKPGKNGWIVEKWSIMQGDMTDQKYRVNYCNDFPADVDLEKPWNDHIDVAEAILFRAEGKPDHVINHGRVVE